MQLVLPRPNRTPGTLDALGLIGLVGLLVGRYVPLATLIPFWGCSFRQLTGIPCPGCGLTRVADRVAHLNVTGALMANPLGTVAALLFALAAVAMVVHLVFGVPLPELVLSEAEWRVVRWVALGLFLANYAFVVFAYRVLHWR
ncbi:MAG: DUF2752 domain-containing protein [Myxococcaceae bacterium]|nr:DUF2752 domain-containing protein [Myxococcaceae bacterium]MCA3014143.1 DUF2752 domain-containing protein [Myxococcaceae bacterium]